MSAPFLPEGAELLDPNARTQMAPRWREWARGTQRSSSVVLTGEETTTDATGDSLALSVTGDTLRCTNATLLRIHGVVPDFLSGLGQSIPVAALGLGHVELVNESASAVARNRIDTGNGLTVRLAAGRGRAWLEYDATSERHRVLYFEQGAPITPAFSSGDYSWTVSSGSVTTMTYYLRGKALRVTFALVGTTVVGTPASVTFNIPGGYTSAGVTRGLFELSDNGTARVGIAQVAAAGSVVTLRRQDGINLAASAGATSMYGSIEFEAAA